MIASPTRFEREGKEDWKDESREEDPGDEDDWLSDWHPPGLSALSLLLFASELEPAARHKPN